MASTLQGQWNAAYGATPVIAQEDQSAIFFQQRVSMAVTQQAVTVTGESTGTTNHTNRVALAKAVLNNPQPYVAPFTQACASQGLDNTSTDSAITTQVASLWNGLSGVA